MWYAKVLLAVSSVTFLLTPVHALPMQRGMPSQHVSLKDYPTPSLTTLPLEGETDAIRTSSKHKKRYHVIVATPTRSGSHMLAELLKLGDLTLNGEVKKADIRKVEDDVGTFG